MAIKIILSIVAIVFVLWVIADDKPSSKIYDEDDWDI